ncbi:MAG: hypothetical protein HKN34_11050 [Gammaproteobacteria bacterium]|nr:hypothetical protein [Gammaproteobacteria bacterium]
MSDHSDISPEDNLRLNVLLAQNPGAIRIDESRMVVYGLTDKGEARIELNPDCEDRQYIRRVKAMLSSHVMGSPGGYPVFLERWTRMGQTRDTSLDQLLLLGESEAVVAVAHAPGLTESLAERAWWAMQDVANARVMLSNPLIASADIGRQLAAFLLEFLPFETESIDMLESVRLVLQRDLIEPGEIEKLWRRAQSRRSLLVGFLHAMPDNLPGSAGAHPALDEYCQIFETAEYSNDPVIKTVKRVFSPQGQSFVKTCELALAKVSDQAVTVSLFEAISSYFATVRSYQAVHRDIAELEQSLSEKSWDAYSSQLQPFIQSIFLLSGISVAMLDPIFGRTDAVGSGMRRKIKPLTDRIFHHLHRLGS